MSGVLGAGERIRTADRPLTRRPVVICLLPGSGIESLPELGKLRIGQDISILTGEPLRTGRCRFVRVGTVLGGRPATGLCCSCVTRMASEAWTPAARSSSEPAPRGRSVVHDYVVVGGMPAPIRRRTAATSLQGAQPVCGPYRERHTALTILYRHDYLLHVTLDRDDPARRRDLCSARSRDRHRPNPRMPARSACACSSPSRPRLIPRRSTGRPSASPGCGSISTQADGSGCIRSISENSIVTASSASTTSSL